MSADDACTLTLLLRLLLMVRALMSLLLRLWLTCLGRSLGGPCHKMIADSGDERNGKKSNMKQEETEGDSVIADSDGECETKRENREGNETGRERKDMEARGRQGSNDAHDARQSKQPHTKTNRRGWETE